MKTTRTYLSGCVHCNAKGFVTPYLDNTVVSSLCPVCNGSKTVLITEVTESIDIIISGRPNPFNVNPYDAKTVKRNLNRIKQQRIKRK